MDAKKEVQEKAEDRYEGSQVPIMSIAVALFAVSFSAILIRWSDAPPLAIALYRLLFTVLLLTPFAFTTMRDDLKRNPISGKEVGQLMLVGVILSFHFALWITSLMLTSVASSVILVTFHAVFVGIVGYYLLGERLSKKNIAGIAIAFIGTAILVYGDFTPGEGNLLSQEAIIGDILAFLGGIMAGAYILAGRYFRRTRGLITYVFIVYSGCALSLLVMCIVTRTPFYYPPNEFLLFLLMAVGPGIMGHTLYNWALKYVKATVVSVSLLGEPIGSSILAFFLLNEAPSSLVMMGGAAILIGIYMTAIGMEATEGPGRPEKEGGPVTERHEEE